MKKSVGIILGFVLSTSAAFAEKTKAEKNAFRIDSKASKVYWTGKKVIGQHTGTLSIYGGDVILSGDKIVSASVKMDMNSIVCTDLTDEQWNKKLVGHLKSNDFFSVEKYPEATFEANGFQPKSLDEDGNNYEVSGALTIKEITHEIKFPAKVNISDSKLTAIGKATINRIKYDIKYGSGSFFKGLGDNMISDEFEISFELVANMESVDL